MSTSRKKVIVRQFGGELHRGYLGAENLLTESGLELLGLDGRAILVSLPDLKQVAYVRDFNPANSVDPEQIGPRSFASRPRGDGLWVRIHFTDDDILEGLVPSGLPLLDTLLQEKGVFLEPSDRRSNTQRLFLPRAALSGFEVLGVAALHSPGRQKGPPRQGARANAPVPQAGLFDDLPGR